MDISNIIPLESYPGRKGGSGSWQKIISEIPKCTRFVEAMAGSAIISSLVTGCQIIINDLDKDVIDGIRVKGNNVKKMNLHYQSIIDLYDYTGSVFYFDPPYLKETRSFQGNIYKHEWNQKDHANFLKAVQTIQQPAMISHYPHQLYDYSLAGWRKISYNSMTRAGLRVENLYMNFPPPVLLQCFKNIGENFTDRQRIKRKVDRLMKRLINEPQQERAAILSAIIEKFTYINKP